MLTNGVPARVLNQRVCETNAPIEIAIGGETRHSVAECNKLEVPSAAIQRNGMIRVGDSGNPAFMIYNERASFDVLPIQRWRWAWPVDSQLPQ